ncbi:MAG TPA: hypothetical protein DCO68_05555 [Methylophilaceae bacterium]|nr:hypothetical protein [Methylophilaceae bacterium]HAJ71526.1 hypothetical protein [Methylophilaceae bacterium]
MKKHFEVVTEFFNSPHYLENGRSIIENRIFILKEFLGELSNVKILDLGCGDGSLSSAFFNTSNQFTLVDISPRMLEIAKSKLPNHMINKVELINSPIENINTNDDYDVVICVGLLAHVPSIDDALKKVSESMKDKAYAVIEFTPNPNPYEKFLLPYYILRKKLFGHSMGYQTNKMSLKRLIQLANNHNLQLIKTRRHYFPIPTISRWPKKLIATYIRFTLHSNLFSKFGTEHIMLLKKNDH